jgi:prolyl-tRNA synthetase
LWLKINLAAYLPALLETIQNDMLKRAIDYREANTRYGSDYQEFKRIMETERGLFIAPWCGNDECEEQIKIDTKATIRCLPFGLKPEGNSCFACGKTGHRSGLFRPRLLETVTIFCNGCNGFS